MAGSVLRPATLLLVPYRPDFGTMALLRFNTITGTGSRVNPLIATLKRQSKGPSYSNTVIGTLTVDEWAVTFGTARKG